MKDTLIPGNISLSSDTRKLVQEIEDDFHLYRTFARIIKVQLNDKDVPSIEHELDLWEFCDMMQQRGEFGRAINLKKVDFSKVLLAIAIDLRDDFEVNIMPFQPNPNIRKRDRYFEDDEDEEFNEI